MNAALIGTGPTRANPLIVALTSGTAPGISPQSPGGFASLLQGLVEYSGTTASAGSAGRPARHNAAPVALAPSKNGGAKLAAMQVKDQNASNAVQAKSLRSAPSLVQRSAPLTVPLTLAPQQATDLTLGYIEAGSETPARARNTPSDAATQTPATVRPFPSTALLPAPISSMLVTGSRSVGSSPQLAFALQLTWQRIGNGTEAETRSRAETSAPVATHDACDGLASSSDAATSKPTNPQIATQASQIMVSEPEGDEAACVSPQPPTCSTGSQGMMEPNFGLDSSHAELRGTTTRSPSAGTRSSAHPVLSSSPNTHMVLPTQAASEFATADSPKILSRAQTPDSLPDLDSPADAVPPQFSVGQAKAAAESHPVASALGVRAGQKPLAPEFAAPDQRAPGEQTDGSPSSRDGTRGTAGATGQRTDAGVSKITESGGAEQDAAPALGSEISARGAPLLEKPTPPTNHDGPSSLPEGVLLAQTPEPGPVSNPPSKPGVDPSQAGSPGADITGPSAQAPQPLREVSLRLAVGTSEASKGSVDVQLAERAGKVQVAVRTADQDLAKSLQGNLGDLVGRLEERGFKTAAWTPAIAPHGESTLREASACSASQNHSGGSGAQDGQPNSRGQQQSGQRRQGRWESEMEQINLGETFHAPG